MASAVAVPEEKAPSSLVDDNGTDGSSRSQLTEELAVNERALVLKMDLRILPALVVVYIMAFIDRFDNWSPLNKSKLTDLAV